MKRHSTVPLDSSQFLLTEILVPRLLFANKTNLQHTPERAHIEKRLADASTGRLPRVPVVHRGASHPQEKQQGPQALAYNG